MKAVLFNGWFLKSFTLAEARAEISGAPSVLFASREDAETFAATLPRFVKAFYSPTYGHQAAKTYAAEGHIARWHELPGGQSVTHGVYARIETITRKTGARNETGEKRRAAFFAALERLEIIPSFNQ